MCSQGWEFSPPIKNYKHFWWSPYRIHALFVSSRHYVSEMLLIQYAFSGPAALASPRNKSEMQTLGPHPRSIESELVLFFFFLIFWPPPSMWDLSSPTKVWTYALWKCGVPTTELPGKSQNLYFNQISICSLNESTILKYALKQWSQTFLATGASFVEDNFSSDQRGGRGG